MERETWVVMLGMAGFALSLFTYLRAMKRDLGIEIAKVDDRVSKVDDRVSKLDDRVSKLDGRVSKLDARVGKVDNRVERTRAELSSVIDARLGQVNDHIENVRAELNGVIGQFRAEVGVRFSTLEQRTFILASQSPEKPTGS